MKVILLEDVKALGKKGDIVEVKEGYGKNCILKKNLGLEATGKNLNDLKLKKANEDKLAAERLAQAKETAKEIEATSVTVSIKMGEGGRSFGSISTKEIAVAAKEQIHMELDKKKIQMKEEIRCIGEFHVTIKIHPEVTAELKVVVEEKK